MQAHKPIVDLSSDDGRTPAPAPGQEASQCATVAAFPDRRLGWVQALGSVSAVGKQTAHAYPAAPALPGIGTNRGLYAATEQQRCPLGPAWLGFVDVVGFTLHLARGDIPKAEVRGAVRALRRDHDRVGA